MVMEQEKKINKVLIASVIIGVVLLISILSVLFALGLLENNNPIYGEFTYMNDDGTEAKVILGEKSVYFENLNYDEMEEMPATYAALDELEQRNGEYTKDELAELRQEYLNYMDFESYYDKKEHSFDDMRYIEEERQYYYYVYYPDINEYGIDMCVDLEERILVIGDMVFQYVK